MVFCYYHPALVQLHRIIRMIQNTETNSFIIFSGKLGSGSSESGFSLSSSSQLLQVLSPSMLVVALLAHASREVLSVRVLTSVNGFAILGWFLCHCAVHS